MIDTLIAFAPQAPDLFASVSIGNPAVVAEGIIDKTNGLINEVDVMFKGAVTVVVGIVVFFLVIRDGFTLKKLLGYGLIGGLVVWLVAFGGINLVSQSVDDEMSASAVVVPIESHPVIA